MYNTLIQIANLTIREHASFVMAVFLDIHQWQSVYVPF
jgi:hypothetical protein